MINVMVPSSLPLLETKNKHQRNFHSSCCTALHPQAALMCFVVSHQLS
jgi:hypothetical protein